MFLEKSRNSKFAERMFLEALLISFIITSVEKFIAFPVFLLGEKSRIQFMEFSRILLTFKFCKVKFKFLLFIFS